MHFLRRSSNTRGSGTLVRYGVVVTLFMIVMGVLVKMVLRLNIKYVLVLANAPNV